MFDEHDLACPLQQKDHSLNRRITIQKSQNGSECRRCRTIWKRNGVRKSGSHRQDTSANSRHCRLAPAHASNGLPRTPNHARWTADSDSQRAATSAAALIGAFRESGEVRIRDRRQVGSSARQRRVRDRRGERSRERHRRELVHRDFRRVSAKSQCTRRERKRPSPATHHATTLVL